MTVVGDGLNPLRTIWLTDGLIQERRIFIQGGNPNRRRHRSGFAHTAVPAYVFGH